MASSLQPPCKGSFPLNLPRTTRRLPLKPAQLCADSFLWHKTVGHRPGVPTDSNLCFSLGCPWATSFSDLLSPPCRKSDPAAHGVSSVPFWKLCMSLHDSLKPSSFLPAKLVPCRQHCQILLPVWDVAWPPTAACLCLEANLERTFPEDIEEEPP